MTKIDDIFLPKLAKGSKATVVRPVKSSKGLYLDRLLALPAKV